MDDIDWSNPVNWKHSLNQDLFCWWLVCPYSRGGTSWYDLTKRFEGVLNNMAIPAVWSVGTNRPGGWGALDFDIVGTNDHVRAPNDPIFYAGTTQFTLSAWMKVDGLSANRYVIAKGLNDSSWETFRLRCDTDNLYNISIQNNGLSQFPQWKWDTSINTGEWNHVACVLTGMTQSASDMKTYLNGIEVTNTHTANGWNSSFSTLDHSTNANAVFCLGSGHNPSPPYFPWDGQLDDVRGYWRALNKYEIFELYHESIRRYPNLLRRRAKIIGKAPAAPAVDQAPMFMPF